MTILITGGTGFIGGQTVLAFLDRGEIPIVLDDLSTSSRAAIPPSIPFFIGDVADTDLVLRIIKNYKVDAILHFAAKIIVPESVADPLGYYLNNTVKTHTLLQSAIKGNVPHFVFSSSAAVYGDLNVTPVCETADPVPLSPYGRSKLMSEYMLVDTSAASDLRHVSLRYFNVAGADPAGRHGQSTPGATHLIKVALEVAVGRRSYMNIYGNDYPTPDGTCIRDYVHVSDLARAHVAALDYLRNGGDSRILNCGYGRGYSVKEVVEAVKKVSGIDFATRQAPRRAGDPASIVANSHRLRELGWQPQLNDLQKMIEHAHNWEKQLTATATVMRGRMLRRAWRAKRCRSSNG